MRGCSVQATQRMEDLKIGSRCSLGYCNQTEFLPYKCKLCSIIYCHGHLWDHECPNKNADDKFALKCPKCMAKVDYNGADDEEEVLKKHQSDPACIEIPKKKREKCFVCYSRLTLVNKYSCPHCSVATCLKHRAEDQHKCSAEVRVRTSVPWRKLIEAC